MSDFIKLTRHIHKTLVWEKAKLKYRAFLIELIFRVRWQEYEDKDFGIVLKPGEYLAKSYRKIVEDFNPIDLRGKAVEDSFSKNDVEGAVKYFLINRFLRQEIRQGLLVLTLCESSIYEENFSSNQTDNQTEIRQKSDSSSGKKNADIQYSKKVRKEEEKIDKKEKSKTQIEKIAVREFVFLTPAEHEVLLAEHGLAKVSQMLDLLDSYKGTSGKTYKSDYHTMKPGGWVFKEISKPVVFQKQPLQSAKEMVSAKLVHNQPPHYVVRPCAIGSVDRKIP